MSYYSVTMYEVEKNRQVLIEGRWTSDDCHWKWSSKHYYYENQKDAEKHFNRLRVTKNCPIIRLYETTFDRYGHVDERNLLEEKF